MRRPAPDLRQTLLLNLLVPTSVLAVALGLAGALLIYKTVETAYDRVLDGSVRAIAERIAVEDGEVTVDLPQVALAMLETRANDSVYYRVFHAGSVITGYKDLPSIDSAQLQPGVIRHFDQIYRGNWIRVAALAQSVYGKPDPVLIEVAETRAGRSAIQRELLEALIALEAGIVLAAAILGWFAVKRGLSPLINLGREIDARGIGTSGNLQPLDLAAIPREAQPPVRAMNMLFVRLETAIRLIRNFTTDASHQMKTPLASLGVHLELLQRAGSQGQFEHEAVAEIERSAKHLGRLIEQLIALARADETALIAGGDEQRVDLVAATADVVNQFAPIAAGRNIDLTFEAAQETIMAAANPHMVHEILVNLIDNAIRYNEDDGFVIARIRSGERQVVQVINGGPGIAPALRDRVFDRFYRIPETVRSSGSGLGLPIVRALVEQNGGTVTLEDGVDGKGLTVSVSFARVDAIPKDRSQLRPA